MPTSCTKIYRDIPFAHRQHAHKGHCALIHGHNWSFEFIFTANVLDACGFVVDFGSLGWVKDKLNELDHALVLNQSDPLLEYLREVLQDGVQVAAAKIVVVADCSCEGLARHFWECINIRLPKERGLRCIMVTVYEDSKNSASFSA